MPALGRKGIWGEYGYQNLMELWLSGREQD